MMDNDTFSSALKEIVILANSRSDKEVSVLWHGGEPLQFDKSTFEKRLVEANNYFFANGIVVNHVLQTALINFDSDWGRIINTYFNSWAGVSIDPNTRSISGSTTRYDDALQKRIKVAQSKGITLVGNICPSIDDVGKEGQLLDWLDSNNIASFAIDRYNSFGGQDPLRPTNQQHSLFLWNLLDESLKRIKKRGRVSVCETLRAGVNGVLNGKSGDRWGVTCLSDYIVIDPDGRTNTCPDKISVEESYTENGSFVSSSKRSEVVGSHIAEHPTDGCFNCEFFSWCRSGCPITPNDWGKEGECSGYKLFLKKIQQLSLSEKDLLLYYLNGKNEENI